MNSAGAYLQNIRKNAENANPTKTVRAIDKGERHSRPTLLSDFVLARALLHKLRSRDR